MQADLKEIRNRYGKTLAECAEAIGTSIEGYRQKELGNIPVSGIELAQLARLYGRSMREVFPSYTPSDGEVLLVQQLAPGIEKAA